MIDDRIFGSKGEKGAKTARFSQHLNSCTSSFRFFREQPVVLRRVCGRIQGRPVIDATLLAMTPVEQLDEERPGHAEQVRRTLCRDGLAFRHKLDHNPENVEFFEKQVNGFGDATREDGGVEETLVEVLLRGLASLRFLTALEQQGLRRSAARAIWATFVRVHK